MIDNSSMLLWIGGGNSEIIEYSKEKQKQIISLTELKLLVDAGLGKRVKKTGTIGRTYIREHYGNSKQIRFITNEPFCPIGYIQTKNPMYKKLKICKYTVDGREEIHKNLQFSKSVMAVIHLLSKEIVQSKSIEYCDNRLSLYSAQYGRCAVTGKVLWIDEINCHHKIPVEHGGTDDYKNLVIVHEDVHKLIHAIKQETINAYLKLINPTKPMLEKINKYRIMAGNATI